MQSNSRILVAPLNWGLGHASRCIPVIKALIENGFEPILASDGVALLFLKKEFPDLMAIELPSYGISYAKSGKYLKFKLIRESPRIFNAIRREKIQVRAIVSEFGIKGIISDNRLGVRHKSIPSVIITHQLNVLSGSTTMFSTKIHLKYIKKFDACWVPDFKDEPSLSGRLGHRDSYPIPAEFLGVISRFNYKKQPIKFDLLVILSGPEPQRSFLEEKLTEQLIKYPGSVCIVQGKIEQEQTKTTTANLTIVNFMTHEELEILINSCRVILSRSGYTTILDLAKIGKKAFLIPTPGQFEQEYLADRLDKMGIIPSSSQDDFDIEQLKRVADYCGFEPHEQTVKFDKLFSLFKGK
ncbi:MAG: glycosyltransferase [Flavobacteriaceae bacterium]|nr:glycosyltransferase [Flavobacteriaceae bacterium]